MSFLWRWLKVIACLSVFGFEIADSEQSKIRIDPDGGYTGIVVKIRKDLPENECPLILENIKVRQILFPRIYREPQRRFLFTTTQPGV